MTEQTIMSVYFINVQFFELFGSLMNAGAPNFFNFFKLFDSLMNAGAPNFHPRRSAEMTPPL